MSKKKNNKTISRFSRDIRLIRWLNIAIVIISSLAVVFTIAFGFSLSVINESIQENGGYEVLESMLDNTLSESINAQSSDDLNSNQDNIQNNFIGISYGGILSQVFAVFAFLTIIVLTMNCLCIVFSSIILAKHKNKDSTKFCFNLSIFELLAAVFGINIINLVLIIISTVRLSLLKNR